MSRRPKEKVKASTPSAVPLSEREEFLKDLRRIRFEAEELGTPEGLRVAMTCTVQMAQLCGLGASVQERQEDLSTWTEDRLRWLSELVNGKSKSLELAEAVESETPEEQPSQLLEQAPGKPVRA